MVFKNMDKIESDVPNWKHPDWRIRRKAVLKIDDQELLIKIAQTDSSDDVRKYAVYGIENQECLKYMYYNETDSDVRSAIVSRIKDESFLINIIYGSDDVVRSAAVRNPNFTDQNILLELACSSSDVSGRSEAVQKVNNKYFLENASLNDPSEYIRCMAISNPNFLNETLLENIACNDPSFRVRVFAVRKISNKEVLNEIILKDEHNYVRFEVVKNPNFDNSAIIEEVVCNDPFFKVRSEAARSIHLCNESVLLEVVKNDSNFDVQMSALENPNLKNEKFLEDIACNHEDSFLRDAAAYKLKNLGKEEIDYS